MNLKRQAILNQMNGPEDPNNPALPPVRLSGAEMPGGANAGGFVPPGGPPAPVPQGGNIPPPTKTGGPSGPYVPEPLPPPPIGKNTGPMPPSPLPPSGAPASPFAPGEQGPPNLPGMPGQVPLPPKTPQGPVPQPLPPPPIGGAPGPQNFNPNEPPVPEEPTNGGPSTPQQVPAGGASPNPGPQPQGNYGWSYDASNPQGSLSTLFGSLSPTSQTLVGLRSQLEAAGIRLENPNAAGITSKIILPNGQIVRVLMNADNPSGPQGWTWVVQPAGGGSGAGMPTGPGPAAAPDELQQAMRAQLLALMNGANQPIDLNSAGITQPMQAAQLTSDRQLEQGRKAMAERLYAEGDLNSGSLDQGVQQSHERAAVGLAGLHAGLVTNEISARREQVSHALDLANAIGARQEAAQLQRELAALDNAYRYAAMQQNADFHDDAFQQWLAEFNRQTTLNGMNG